MISVSTLSLSLSMPPTACGATQTAHQPRYTTVLRMMRRK
jgi:hypothetical protein